MLGVSAMIGNRKSYALNRRLPSHLISLLCALSIGASECEDEDPEPNPRITAPPLNVPSLGSDPPSRPSQVPAGTTLPPQQGAAYPLNVSDAMGSLAAGYALAGRLPNGGEVFLTRVVRTDYESKTVYEEKCEYEYDYYEKKNVYKCKQRPVTKNVAVNRNAFQVSGSGMGTVEFSNAVEAVNRSVQLGADRWRLTGGRSGTS